VVDGFLLVDKPATWTSHDVVGKVRRLLAMKRVGHAGTLDPMATGLLVLGLGRATRLLRFIQDLPKEYVADVLFGVATDSGDADGRVVEESAPGFSEEELRAALRSFVGTIDQVPPAVSAIKRGGKRLHQLTRAGVVVELAPRPVEVYHIELMSFALPRARLRVRCGKGTYIRALGDDIARALGTRAHLTSLRRTASGSLSVEDAATIETLEEDAPASVLPPAGGLRDLVSITLPPEQRGAARNGAAIVGVAVATVGPVAVLDDAELIGVYSPKGDVLVPEVVVA
jgi:tRNA pseudouridine55 synthase